MPLETGNGVLHRWNVFLLFAFVGDAGQGLIVVFVLDRDLVGYFFGHLTGMAKVERTSNGDSLERERAALCGAFHFVRPVVLCVFCQEGPRSAVRFPVRCETTRVRRLYRVVRPRPQVAMVLFRGSCRLLRGRLIREGGLQREVDSNFWEFFLQLDAVL